MPHDASDLARRLAQSAEAVCRYYLSNGRRVGRYWRIGDVRNTPGSSLYVRLTGGETGRGAAGKWTDGATGEHGDLLDIIREACGFTEFREVADEARRFLGLPTPERPLPAADARLSSAHARGEPQVENDAADASEAARRLFKATRPIRGTLAETYLRQRGISPAAFTGTDALRFHPNCFYRTDTGDDDQTWPALIAAVTSLEGTVTGVHRTWLDLLGRDKAAVDTPRRALGHLLGHAVRFGTLGDVLAAGEGIETVLSVRCVLPRMPMVAALSAAHLAALGLPAGLRRLYIIRDADTAGDRAVGQLTERGGSAGIDVRVLSPQLGDFNDDLTKLGTVRLRSTVRKQLTKGDAVRFMEPAMRRRVGASGGGS